MGSSSNRASREAERAEQQRQARILATQASTNRIFDDPRRQAEIADAVAAVRERSTGRLNREKADADKQLKFALARNGMFGSSTQLDQQKRLGESYSEGVLEADRAAREVGANIEAQDQQARANLLALSTSGLDATTGAQQAAAALRNNLEAGKATSLASSFNLASGTFADYLKRSREAAERRQADRIAGFGFYSTPTRG